VTPFPPPVRVPGGVAVFADAHLGQADGDADDFLEALATVRRRGLSTVVFLGDIFHYFIGDARFETPLVRRVLDAWKELAASGTSLRYVEGNRDFFLRGTRFVSSFAAYGGTDGLDVGGVTYAFVHGDRVNTRDLPYRFWRLVSKNPVSRGALALIPGPLARAAVRKTEARLYRTNFRHKSRLPEAELLAEGRRARRAGYDRLLVGHFHVGRLLEAPDGIVQVLPAWLEERTHVEIDGAGRLALVEEPGAERAMRRVAGPS
jgi:UDP-2,3-diacylglucosamine hydrolase